VTASQPIGLEADPSPAGTAGPPALPAEGDKDERRRRRRRLLLLLFLLGIWIILMIITIWYLLFRQPLTELPGIPESQVPAYSTSYYEVSQPVGVAVSPSGDRIYAAESSGKRALAVLDANGTVLARGVPPTSSNTTDHVPVYVAVDPVNGEVYVSDRPAAAVYIYDRDGAYQRQFQPPQDHATWQPLGLAFDKAGNLYVTDLSGTQSVLVFGRDGKLVRTIGADAGFTFPNGVAIDDAGIVYVTDSNNGRLLAFDAQGAIIARVGRGASDGMLGLPRGIARDDHGRVFVVDATGQQVSVYRTAASGSNRLDFLESFGTMGVADGQFAYPNGMAVDGRGRVYVADTMNNRIQVWSY
jgi:DNA-binding beta-propeller fold protein YncE